MIAPSFNFDLGVKNYTKNRLIVNAIHLKNEILYNIEKTDKLSFTISGFSYYNKPNKLFLNVVEDMKSSSLGNSFHFYINEQGNVLTDLEISSPSKFYENQTDSLNVVVCLSGKNVNTNNEGESSSLYSYVQMKSFTELVKTFYKTVYELNFKNITVDNNYDKITNLGFDLEKYGNERLLNV